MGLSYRGRSVVLIPFTHRKVKRLKKLTQNHGKLGKFVLLFGKTEIVNKAKVFKVNKKLSFSVISEKAETLINSY